MTSDAYEAVLGELEARARRYRGECDRDAVLDLETEDLVRRALGLASPPEQHLRLIEAVGLMFWYQYLSLRPGDGEDRLEAASQLFAISMSNGGDRSVPAPIRVRLGDVDADSNARLAGAERAVELFAHAARTHDGAVLDEAIELLEASLTGSASPDTFAANMANLCQARALRFDLSGGFDDIERAAQLGERAVAVALDQSVRLGCAITLLLTWCSRYGRCRDSDDFDRIEELGSALLESVPSGDLQHGQIASTLGDAFRARYDVTSADDDLERSVEFTEQASSDASIEDPRRATYLANLSEGLLTRFFVHGESDDLDRAILVARRAIEDDPSSSGPRMYAEVNLSNALQERFEMLGRQHDIDEAIRGAESALAACRSADSDAQIAATCLAGAFRARFVRTHRPTDIERAVRYLEGALTSLAAGDPRWITIALDLCDALRMQYEALAERDRVRSGSIDLAIEVGNAALERIGSDDPRLAELTLNLGHAWRARWRSGDDRAAVTSLEHMRQAARHRSARPATRADAAREWGRAAVAGADWEQAIEAYQQAVELLALVSPRSLGPSDQEHRLSPFGGLAGEAAAVCVEAGRFELAAELFEQGRGVLFSQALDTRTDVTALSDVEPALAERFTSLRDQLDRKQKATGQKTDSLHARAARRARADEFDRIVIEIRRIGGFERFLLPTLASELLEVAEHGPVALINVAGLRSDALILRPSGIDVVPLPQASPQAVAEQVEAFFEAVEQVQDHGAESEDARVEGERRVTEVLVWLWENIAGPVLERLGEIGRSPREAGRPETCLWWCPSGALSLLPLHAAGRHRTGRDESRSVTREAVLDHVVSSTIPTMRALRYARRARVAPDAARLLVVGDATTPGVEDEVVGILANWDGVVTLLGLPGAIPATRGAVVSAFTDHSWVHFACHGYSDADDPSSGSLEISADPLHRLTVRDIAGAHHESAELAFLSACETAKPSGSVVDECIHLASACQLAGYRHVIATLWPVVGDDAASFSEDVYRFFRDAGSDSRATHTRAAVHHATRLARRRYPTEPTRWACFVHVGT